ncbi:MAG TPA: BON domain-containing protein [Burkholderiales bacterium]|jgi:hyperosmotically inducible protein|nr:BON domain-containing protein [Burkholderiales bacterium]
MRALVFIGLFLTQLPGWAQPAGEPSPAAVPRADFAALDRNKDGFLSKLEAAGDREIAKRFSTFDADGDGRLSEAEYIYAKQDNERRILRDAALTARVKAALLAEKGIPSLSISVETYEGQVQLSGFVPAPDIVSRAGRVTAGVSGVRTVHNNIAVK